jgi:hypothetical protein
MSKIFIQLLKGLTIVWALVTLVCAFITLPPVLSYLNNPPSELVSISRLILQFFMAGLAIAAGLETALFGWLAYLEVPLRRERLVLTGIFGGLAAVAIGLFLQLRQSLF